MGRRLELESGSLDLAAALASSVARSPLQSAGVLAGLAGLATMHPLAGLASAAAGAAFLALRPKRPSHDLLGRDAEEVVRLNEGFSLPLGREIKSGRPIVLSGDDARQHLLVLGTTGAAKTEFFLGMSEAAISQGAGLLFVNAKGDVSLFAKAWQMARRHGRLDDLLVLNLMTGSPKDFPQDGGLLSNTMNPFATGGAESLAELLLGMMDESGGEGAMLKDMARALLPGLLGALAHLRDAGRIEIDAGTIRDHLGLGPLMALRSAEGMPEESRSAIDAYLASLPSYNPERGPRQAQPAMDRHASLQMLLIRMISDLADRYGHVFKHAFADIDFADVVLNRRILIVMLPVLEMTGDSQSNLGRIVLVALKGMMEGAHVNVIELPLIGDAVGVRPPGRPPFVCILDDVGHYPVYGLALAAARAWSLGFSMVYGASDIPALKRLNEGEAASIIANTNTKIFMRNEEVEATVTLASTGPFEIFDDRPSRGLPGRGKVDLGHLDSGEMLVMYKSAKFFARCVFPNEGRTVGPLRANHFVPMPRPQA